MISDECNLASFNQSYNQPVLKCTALCSGVQGQRMLYEDGGMNGWTGRWMDSMPCVPVPVRRVSLLPGVDPVLAAEGVLDGQPAVVELQGGKSAFIQTHHLTMCQRVAVGVVSCALETGSTEPFAQRNWQHYLLIQADILSWGRFRSQNQRPDSSEEPSGCRSCKGTNLTPVTTLTTLTTHTFICLLTAAN